MILEILRKPISCYNYSAALRIGQNGCRNAGHSHGNEHFTFSTATAHVHTYLEGRTSQEHFKLSKLKQQEIGIIDTDSSREHFSQTKHPLGNDTVKKVKTNFWDNPVPHPIYTESELTSVQKIHFQPKKLYDRAALFAVKVMRSGFDFVTRYRGPGGGMTKRDWLNRCLFLETVAGVPGMVAGMTRHMKSLRIMQRDHGWIHTLLEEAENERMHLLIFMKLKEPNLLFRFLVIGAQGVFFNMFFLSYLISPKTCHRFVGYLEEEAVKTYSGLLQDIEDGHLDEWSKEAAPVIAKGYYKLDDDATVKDVIRCIRADEANHRDVNHTFASLDTEMDPNPFIVKNVKK